MLGGRQPSLSHVRFASSECVPGISSAVFSSSVSLFLLLHTHLLPHNYTHIMSKSFSTSDVASHNKADNLWIIVDQDVYDLTKFQEEHPGGKKSK